MHEICYLDGTQPTYGSYTCDWKYYQEAVAACLNSQACVPNGYPCNTTTVADMINSTYDGGSYQVSSSVWWSKTQVCDYWASCRGA